jgi:hypothetical protein
MKPLIIFLLFILTSFSVLETNVYICGSSGAKKYHYTENCRGLSACKHEIVKTTKSNAESLGLSLCGWED